MKMIVAYIRPLMKDEVVERLRQMEVPGASLSEVDGFGLESDAGGDKTYGPEVSPYQRVVKLEIVCTNETADPIASAIAETAQTGRRGDGKVFVLPVTTAIDIRTHDTGDQVL